MSRPSAESQNKRILQIFVSVVFVSLSLQIASGWIGRLSVHTFMNQFVDRRFGVQFQVPKDWRIKINLDDRVESVVLLKDRKGKELIPGVIVGYQKMSSSKSGDMVQIMRDRIRALERDPQYQNLKVLQREIMKSPNVDSKSLLVYTYLQKAGNLTKKVKTRAVRMIRGDMSLTAIFTDYEGSFWRNEKPIQELEKTLQISDMTSGILLAGFTRVVVLITFGGLALVLYQWRKQKNQLGKMTTRLKYGGLGLLVFGVVLAGCTLFYYISQT